MAFNEHTSPQMASLASRAMTDPASLTLDEIRSLGGCVLTQASDHNTTKNALGLAAWYSHNAMWWGGPYRRTSAADTIAAGGSSSPPANYLRRGGV